MAGRLGAPNSGRVTTSSFIGDMSPVATDGFFLIPYKASEITDGIVTSDPLAVNWNMGEVLTDGFELTEPQVTLLVTILAEAADSLTVADAFGEFKILSQLTDSISTTDAYAPSTVYSQVETQGIKIQQFTRISYPKVIVEAITLAASLLDPSQEHSIELLETIAGLDSYISKLTYTPTTTESVRLAAALFVGYAVNASDDIEMQDVLSAVKAVAILESLGLSSTVIPSLTYNLSYTETVKLYDSLRKFFSGDITDTIEVESVLLPFRKAPATATDGIEIEDVLTKNFIIRLVAKDSFNIDDVDAIKMLFNPIVVDGVHISAAYIAPGDNFTTWTINTRTGATTEYTNYVFNSFAKFGNTYIGANSEGLFELQGTTDAGDNIIADLKSGLMQMAATKFTMFRAAYLGIRGEGNFVLRLVSGDGDVFNYSFNANSMITTKVPLGKGLRARYFSFELISDESDFDMESIEFIPLVAQRRV